MKTALIISGGEYSKTNIDISYDYVIACDKGALYADKMGIKPDLIIGDFDSFDGDINSKYSGIEIETFPVMKDDTDTMLAIKRALAIGCKHIVIACALGGRMDHLISNIQSLSYIASCGATGEIVSENDRLRTLADTEGAATLKKHEGFSLSIYALSDKCTGVSIRGALYEIEDAELTNTFPLGHGNSFVEDEVEISLKTGTILIVESRLEPGAHT